MLDSGQRQMLRRKRYEQSPGITPKPLVLEKRGVKNILGILNHRTSDIMFTLGECVGDVIVYLWF